MRLIIFGATGTLGKHLVDRALDMGHDVTAFTRDRANIEREHSRLNVFEGDVLDYAPVHDAIDGMDAVICTLGAGRKGKVRAAGTLNITKAMQESNVDRLVCQTTLGCGESWNNLNFFWKRIMFGMFLKQAFVDHQNQEKIVTGTNLDWTIVRPAGFTDGGLTKKFVICFQSGNRSLELKISRADVAYFILRTLTGNEYHRKAVGISY